MSKANRKMMYDKLVREGRLDQDDGALVREFGAVIVEEPKTKKVKGKK